MTRKFTLLALTVLLGMFATSAYADSITFTLTNPHQTVSTAGGTFNFNATVTAAANNTGTVYLNADDYSVASPVGLNDDAFFNTFAASLTPGQSYTGLLFTLSVPAGTTPGKYSGNFDLYGGSVSYTDPSGGSSDLLGSVAFDVTAAAPTVGTVTPEPSSLMLLGTGVLGVIGAARRKLGRSA